MGSYLQVQHIRPGFDMSRHLLFATLLPATEHPKANLYEDMLGRLSALPGVRRVASVGSPPLSGSGGGAQRVSIPGTTDEPVGIGAYWVGRSTSPRWARLSFADVSSRHSIPPGS